MDHEGVDGDHDIIVVLVAVTGLVGLVMMLICREMRMQEDAVGLSTAGLIGLSLMEMCVWCRPTGGHEAQRRRQGPDPSPHHRPILGGPREPVKPPFEPVL